MKKTILHVLCIVQLCMVSFTFAQPIISKDTIHRNSAYFRTGIEPTVMITLGYQRIVNNFIFNRILNAYAEWGVSAFRLSYKNSELKAGGVLPVYERKYFKIVNNVNVSSGSNATHLFDSKKIAAADEVAFGFCKTSWFVAITAEYEKILLTHLKQTEFYRTTYYEDAKDGWYKGSGGLVQFGIEAVATFKENYDLYFEIKKPYTENLNAYGGSPLHVNSGLGFRF